jgi:hypothetical protein
LYKKVQESHSSRVRVQVRMRFSSRCKKSQLVGSGGIKVQEFQLEESSIYKKIKEESDEAKTSDISHGSQKVGKKTGSRMVKIKCALPVI